MIDAHKNTQILTRFVTNNNSVRFFHTINPPEPEMFFLPPDSHTSFEFMLVLQGTVWHSIKGETYIVNAGDGILIDKNEIHTLKVNLEKPFERFVLHFNANAVPEIFNEFLEIVKPFTQHNPNRVIRREHMDQYLIRELLYDMDRLISLNTPFSMTIVKLKIIELLIELNKLMQSIDTDFATPLSVSPAVNKAIEFIDKNIDKNISLEDIANAVFLSKYYLCRTFKENIGIPLYQYVMRKKIFKAKELIEQGENATSVCYKLGFQSYPAFFTNYKKIFSYGPKSKNINI